MNGQSKNCRRNALLPRKCNTLLPGQFRLLFWNCRVHHIAQRGLRLCDTLRLGLLHRLRKQDFFAKRYKRLFDFRGS